MEFIEFIWPLMAFILKGAGILFVLYCIGSWMASAENKPSILRNIVRYTIFILIFPFMLIIGYIMRAITHPSDRP